jgi:hypothetical protein
MVGDKSITEGQIGHCKDIGIDSEYKELLQDFEWRSDMI